MLLAVVLMGAAAVLRPVDGVIFRPDLVPLALTGALLAAALYVLHSKEVDSPAKTSARGTNAVLRNTLLVWGSVAALVSAVALAVPEQVLPVLFPTANATWGNAGLLRSGTGAAQVIGLAILAVFAARQGAAHEQRRTAQVVSLFLGGAVWNEWAHPIVAGKWNLPVLGGNALVALVLTVALYALKPEHAGSPKKHAPAAASAAPAAETPKRGRGRAPSTNTPKRK